MKIKIQKKHIKDGKYCNAQSCPVSLAIRDALGLDLGQVAVYGDKCRVLDTYLDLPNQVDAFVNSFDLSEVTGRKEELKPFSFELDYEPEKIN
jgi:hypothetical protein